MIQTAFKNQNVSRGQLFGMQNNVELGVRPSEGVMVVSTFGTREGPKNIDSRGKFLSERHFLLWSPDPMNRVRTGKFRLNYGLNDPNHTRFIKSNLGFGANSESYVLEFTRLFEKGEVIISQNIGRIDLPREQNSEKSSSAHIIRYAGEEARLGANVLIGESPQKRRALIGTHGVVGFRKAHYLKYEVNFERSHSGQNPSTAVELVNSFTSFGTTVTKGLLAYVFHEAQQADLDDHQTLQQAPGVGLQWLPVPHFELQTELKRTFRALAPGNPADSAWFVFHLYL
jgi:hypothetical protein